MSDKTCLHCAIMDAIGKWSVKNGEKMGKNVAVDASDIVASLAECIVHLVNGSPNQKEKEEGIKFAHAAIDAFAAATPDDDVFIEAPNDTGVVH